MLKPDEWRADGAPEYAARIKGASGTTNRAASETQQLGFGYPEVGSELAKRWNLPQTLHAAIRYQAQPHLAPDGQPYARVIAQAMEIFDALEQHGGPTDQARDALGGPLFEGSTSICCSRSCRSCWSRTRPSPTTWPEQSLRHSPAPVGAALRRERGAKRPQDFSFAAETAGAALRPFRDARPLPQ